VKGGDDSTSNDRSPQFSRFSWNHHSEFVSLYIIVSRFPVYPVAYRCGRCARCVPKGIPWKSHSAKRTRFACPYGTEYCFDGNCVVVFFEQPTINMDIGLADHCITLTIKAPNQQIDDQIVKCKLDWSVGKLKGYIHEMYPNKPVSFPSNCTNRCASCDESLLNMVYRLSENRGPKVDLFW